MPSRHGQIVLGRNCQVCWNRLNATLTIEWCITIDTWWCRQMETFLIRYWSFVRGISLKEASVTGLWQFFSCAWTNGSVDNRSAGDLRRHNAHYDVPVIKSENKHYSSAACLRFVCATWLAYQLSKVQNLQIISTCRNDSNKSNLSSTLIIIINWRCRYISKAFVSFQHVKI